MCCCGSFLFVLAELGSSLSATDLFDSIARRRITEVVSGCGLEWVGVA